MIRHELILWKFQKKVVLKNDRIKKNKKKRCKKEKK